MDLESLRVLIDRFGYLVLFAVAFIDGFHIMLVGGFLVALNYLDALPTFMALFLGDFLSDLVWFYLAYFGGERVVRCLSPFHRDIPRHIDKAKKLLENYTGRMILVAKFTFGIAIATLLAAGLSRISPKKFIFYDLLGNLVLVLGMTSLGYIFGESYEIVGGYFRTLGIILLVVLVLGVIIWDRWNKKRKEKDN